MDKELMYMLLKLGILKPQCDFLEECNCCIKCHYVLICYETWKRGNIRTCEYMMGEPQWCSKVANLITEALGEKEFRLSLPHPIPKNRIEKWEDE